MTKIKRNPIFYKLGYCTMKLYNKNDREIAETKFDKSDINLVSSHKWHLSVNGYVTCSKPFMRLHNVIIGTHKGYVTDHINGDKLDNRKCNLREVLQKYNCLNRKCKGYVYEPRNKYRKWKVQLIINGKYVYSRCYLTEQEAINGAKEIRRKYFGEYAYKYAA